MPESLPTGKSGPEFRTLVSDSELVFFLPHCSAPLEIVLKNILPPPTSAPAACPPGPKVRPPPFAGPGQEGNGSPAGWRQDGRLNALRPEIKQDSVGAATCKSPLREGQFQVTSELRDSHRHPTPPSGPPCLPSGGAWEPRHRALPGFIPPSRISCGRALDPLPTVINTRARPVKWWRVTDLRFKTCSYFLAV